MARQIYTEVDNSLSVAGAGSMVAGIVVVSDKGKVDRAVKLETESDLIELYGNPDHKKSTTMYSAISYLKKASGLQVARCIHTAAEGSIETDTNRTARYSAALIRGKVSSLPDTIPDASYQPDRIVEPYKTATGYGLTQADIDSFSFPVYSRSRTYEKLSNKVISGQTNQASLLLADLDTSIVKIGSKLSFGETVDDNSPYYEVTNIEKLVANLSYVKVDKPITLSLNDTARRVTISKESYPTAISLQSNATKGQSSLTLNSVSNIESGQTVSIGTDANLYVIQSVDTATNRITLRSELKTGANANLELFLHKRTYIEYPSDKLPTVLQAVSGSDTVLLSTNDLIGEGDIITFMTGLTNAETEFEVTDKGIYKQDEVKVSLDREVTSTVDTIIQLMTNSEFENRDVLLIYSDNQGTWGDAVTVKILKSTDYPDTARIIKVFYKGVDTGEKFEVTFEEFVDGLGKQLYVESVINDKSNYIRVKHNTDMVDSDGNPILPLINDYSVWREEATDIFSASMATTAESLTLNETDVRVSDFTALDLGDRIKFGSFKDEYKVTGKSSTEVNGKTEYHITIDRGIQVDKISNKTTILKYTGQELKKISKIEKTYPDYKPNSNMTISGNNGILLDAGANQFTGGHNGSIPDVGDMIQCLQKVFSNRNEITVNILLSGGIYSPSYAQALDTLCQGREDCFAYLSNDPANLDYTDAVTATQNFRSSLNINSRWSALFADWGIAYDQYNKLDVAISLDGVAAALQSFAADGGVWGVPVAGWSSGNTFYIKSLVKTWTEDNREDLLSAQINPCKYDATRGISIWGNKTLYGSRSFMQARNVAFILIQMRIECRDYMESNHWKVNDASQRAIMANTLLDSFQKYMVVLNDLQIKDQTTAVDEDANQIKFYIAIQPKGLIEDIYVTLGVFNNSQGITIS